MISFLRDIKILLSKTSAKISLAVSGMVIAMLFVMNAVVIEQSKDVFVNVVGTVTIDSAGDLLFSPINPISSRGQINILTFDSNGKIRPKPLQEVYVENLQQVLLKVALLAVAISLFIGIASSRIFSRPLNRLSSGIQKLRRNDYKFKLEKTGTLDFDIVIEEFNRLIDELQRVEDLRKDLISDTSHELKTPLTSLTGQLEGMKDNVLDSSPERITKLLDNVYRLNDLVERLQEFSRIRNKNAKLRKQDLVLKDVLERVIDSLKNDIQKQNLKINIDISSETRVRADEYLLQRIFENFITNTLRYAQATELTIRMMEGNLIIEDNGIGIDEEHLPFIFERFYRVEKSRNRKTGGLGLGLAIVQELVQSHGWKIEVESKTKEVPGIRFTISNIL